MAQSINKIVDLEEKETIASLRVDGGEIRLKKGSRIPSGEFKTNYDPHIFSPGMSETISIPRVQELSVSDVSDDRNTVPFRSNAFQFGTATNSGSSAYSGETFPTPPVPSGDRDPDTMTMEEIQRELDQLDSITDEDVLGGEVSVARTPRRGRG